MTAEEADEYHTDNVPAMDLGELARAYNVMKAERDRSAEVGAELREIIAERNGRICDLEAERDALAAVLRHPKLGVALEAAAYLYEGRGDRAAARELRSLYDERARLLIGQSALPSPERPAPVGEGELLGLLRTADYLLEDYVDGTIGTVSTVAKQWRADYRALIARRSAG